MSMKIIKQYGTTFIFNVSDDGSVFFGQNRTFSFKEWQETDNYALYLYFSAPI